MPSPTDGPITEQPCARLCVIKQWPDFQGFGFNLTSKSGRSGHFVECIEAKSPAAYAGLKNSDKIIEVNGEVIVTFPHAQVAERIKASPSNEVTLLVVDEVSENHFNQNGIRDLRSSDNLVTIRGPQARLCVIKQWPDFQGFGFNLTSKSGRSGHFVECIEAESPAAYAGLKKSDKIIEVNGEVIATFPHAQVAERIKVSPSNEVSLLVVDQFSENYFCQNGIRDLRSSDNLVTIRGPQARPPNSTKKGGKVTIGGTEVRNKRSTSAEYQRYSVPTPSPNTIAAGVSLVGPTVTNGDNMPIPIVVSNEVNVYGPPLADSELKVRPHTISSVRIQEEPNGRQPSQQMPKLAQRQVSTREPLDTAPKPRLCRLLKTSTRDSFGFLLRTYNDNQEKVIIEVEPNSIAARTGVKNNDILIEVNGVNVGTENHRQVSARLAENPMEVRLLLLTRVQYDFYQRDRLVPKSTQSNVIVIETKQLSRGHVNHGFEVDIEVIPPTPDVVVSKEIKLVGATLSEERPPTLRHEYSQVSEVAKDDFLMNLTNISAKDMRDKLQSSKSSDRRVECDLADSISKGHFEAKHDAIDNI